jgi:transposase-like protein
MRGLYTRKQRSELVDLVTTGRATVSKAAAQLGVTPSTAYYWTRAAASARPGRRVRRGRAPKALALAGSTFVRVVLSGEAGAAIVVRVGAAEVRAGGAAVAGPAAGRPLAGVDRRAQPGPDHLRALSAPPGISLVVCRMMERTAARVARAAPFAAQPQAAFIAHTVRRPHAAPKFWRKLA